MNIGIDFDNTIAKYDNLFNTVVKEEGLIEADWKGNNKTELRDYLRNKPQGEKIWMRLQGLVYGKYMHRAKPMPNILNFLT